MRGCQAEVSRGSEEAGLERHQVLCVQQNSDQEKTRYNLYRYIICENLEKVLYYIVNELKEKRKREHLCQLMVLFCLHHFKTQRGADHQSLPSDKIELFCREDKNYLKRFFT